MTPNVEAPSITKLKKLFNFYPRPKKKKFYCIECGSFDTNPQIGKQITYDGKFLSYKSSYILVALEQTALKIELVY